MQKVASLRILAPMRIPFFNLDEGNTPVPRLKRHQAEKLVRIILANEAIRPRRRTHHEKLPMQSQFIHYSGDRGLYRGSDVPERKFASIELLMGAGPTEQEACHVVAKLLGPKIGSSRRGRPRKTTRNPTLHDRAQIVRSSYNAFKWRVLKMTSRQFAKGLVKKWYQYAHAIALWRTGKIAFPSCWQASSVLVPGPIVVPSPQAANKD